MRLFVFSVRS